MKRLTYDYVKSQFEKEGYTLLTKEYKNSRQKLDYICKNHHRHSIRWNDFKKGIRCPHCSRNAKKTIEEIRANFEAEGYTLLTKKYKNNKQKLEYICPKGHRCVTTIASWSQGKRCRICANENRKNKLKLDFNIIKESFEKEGYTLLTRKDEYKNATSKLRFLCPNHHENTTTWASWYSGRRCSICSNRRKKSISDIKQSFENEGYKIISKEYKDNKSYLKIVCPLGHEFRTKWNDFQQGHRCPVCFHHISKAEKEVFSFLKPYFSDIVNNDRSLIKPLELDIVIPSKKTAIEFCGLYWHSESAGKDKNYHLNKLNKCNEAGYRLITIFEDEWLHKKDIVKNRLLYLLGISNSEKIYARNCTIKEINNSTKNYFLNTYHLQESDSSRVKLGLFYNDKLVSVMTFSKGSLAKHNLKDNDSYYELSRFCLDYNYNVVGSAGKLLKYFINNYNPSEIISYADKRWSDGDLYKKLGFTFEHDSQPNYWYIVGDKRVHRFNFRKSELNKKLKHFDPNLTEYQNMLNNGYHRIYDCGNSKWVLTI